MRRIKLVIEYNGSRFHGWQIQNNAHTVQQEIEQALKTITKETIRITGAGRTDTGVHAYGQVAHFDTQSTIPSHKFADALNCVLPPEISIVFSEEMSLTFHARFSAVGKTYEYRIFNRGRRSPHYEDRAWHIREKLDIEKMEQAAHCFLGTHDFTAYCSSGHSIVTFERTIDASRWIKDGESLIYRVTGNGFLYNMVRIMTGTMVEVGLGRRSIHSITDSFLHKDRNLVGITAPPQGLYLVKVHYDPMVEKTGAEQ